MPREAPSIRRILARLTRPALALDLKTARRDHDGHDDQKEADDATNDCPGPSQSSRRRLAASETTYATSSRIK
jgi:hypothetical protein